MYRNFPRDFLRVDLEGNITNTLDVSTKSKLNEYLSSLFKGLSETATTEKSLMNILIQQKKSRYSKDYWKSQYLQQQFLFPYSPIYFTRGSRSMIIWNQRWKYCSSSISRCILITNIIV
jgi:hypothetical protein